MGQSSTVSIKTKLKPNRPSCKTVHNLKRIVVVKPSCFNHSARTVHQRIFLTISSTLLKREKLEPYMCPHTAKHLFLSCKEVEKILHGFPEILHEETTSIVKNPKKKDVQFKTKTTVNSSQNENPSRTRSSVASHGDGARRSISAGRKSYVEKPRKRES